jgi:glycosyltransferase involved in cell wall biosynthesis
MSEEELYRLYLDCDVLVNPHKGEGFGLIPREFAATGGISLVTDWSGTADDLAEWGWPLAYTLERADWTGIVSLAGQDLGMWAAPDVEGVTRALLQVAEQREWYQAQALARAQRVHELYNWRQFAEQVLGIYREAAEKHGNHHRLQAFA